MISLGGGMPNFSTFPFKRFTAELADGTMLEISDKAQMEECLQYSPTGGLPRLVKHLQALQLQEHNPPSGQAKLCVTTGCQDALSKAFDMLLDVGDSILVENPTYSGSLAYLKPLGAKLVGVPTQAGCLDSKALRRILTEWSVTTDGAMPKVLYTIPTGSNPSGGSLSEAQKAEIYAVAQEFDLIILEDDPYHFLQFLKQGESRTRSFFSMDVDGRVIRFDSFSKLLSSGMRVGFATGPTPLIERLELHSQSTVLHSAGLPQALVASLFDHWAAENDGNSYIGFVKHVHGIAEFYRERSDFFFECAAKHLTGLATWTPPRAGMFAWFKLLGVKDSWPLIKEKAVSKKVILVPGQSFTVPDTEPSPYVRAAFSTASFEDMEEALRRFAEVLREHRDQAPSSE
jgi:kynurenine/2-aminoadipate aminotransferase